MRLIAPYMVCHARDHLGAKCADLYLIQEKNWKEREMNTKQIIIDINENGECSINGEGFSGPECEKFMREIQNEIGSIKASSRKPEYNCINKIKNQNRVRN